MKEVRIAELKSHLSEYLRYVQRGESLAVFDRNTAIANIVPAQERPRLRIRMPAPGSPAPNEVPLPPPACVPFDIVALLLEERENQR